MHVILWNIFVKCCVQSTKQYVSKKNILNTTDISDVGYIMEGPYRGAIAKNQYLLSFYRNMVHFARALPTSVHTASDNSTGLLN